MSCPLGTEVWIGCLRGSWISLCSTPLRSHTPGSFVACAADVEAGGGGGGGGFEKWLLHNHLKRFVIRDHIKWSPVEVRVEPCNPKDHREHFTVNVWVVALSEVK